MRTAVASFVGLVLGFAVITYALPLPTDNLTKAIAAKSQANAAATDAYGDEAIIEDDLAWCATAIDAAEDCGADIFDLALWQGALDDIEDGYTTDKSDVHAAFHDYIADGDTHMTSAHNNPPAGPNDPEYLAAEYDYLQAKDEMDQWIDAMGVAATEQGIYDEVQGVIEDVEDWLSYNCF